MTTAIFLLFIALFAISEAWRDGAAIARHEPINHGKGLLFRLAICGIFFGCASALHWLIAHDFRFLLFAPMGWAAFTMLFRFALNAERGLDWRYVSPSNWYDWAFLWLGSIPGRGMYFGTVFSRRARLEFVESWATIGYHAGFHPWVTWAHRAGTLAYALELAVFLASIAAFIAL